MTWEQLKQINAENKKIAEQESMKEITECPECGWTVLKENKNQQLHCPICGWTNRR